KPVVLYAPNRLTNLQSQAVLRDSENAIAIGSRKYAEVDTSATPRAATFSLANRATVPVTDARVSQLNSPKATPQALKITPKVLNPDPGIWFVNNHEKNFVLTPGGYITISGKGFGNSIGQVNAFGATDGHKLAYQVVDWHDDQIYAVLPVGVRG